VWIVGSTLDGKDEFFAKWTFHEIPRNGTKPDLRAAQIYKDSEMLARFPTESTNSPENSRVFLVGAVRRIETKDRDSPVAQAAQNSDVSRSRPDGRYDLRANGCRIHVERHTALRQNEACSGIIEGHCANLGVGALP
jgi:hypothetical protein